MKTVSVGIIGAGFSASLHAEGLKKVYGIRVEIAAVAARTLQSAEQFANRHQIASAYSDFRELLKNAAIDVVCICLPNPSHITVAIAAAVAGKHVICEKPLTGAFSNHGSPTGDGRARAEAEIVTESVDLLGAVIARTGVLFMYAENWVYAPAMAKTKALIAHSRGTILDIRAEESHSGSHAVRTRRRETAGGGALLTLGSHAIGAAIHLKTYEAQLSGSKPVHVSSVTADVATFSNVPDRRRSRDTSWLIDDWVDVERWANVVLSFTDGTRAIVTASFAMLGGVRNLFEVYTTNAVFRGNMTPNDGLVAFTPDEKAFGDEYLHEKIESRAGWNSVAPDEAWIRGYSQEMQDFMTCVAEIRQPVSDFALAREVVEVVYASYVSAEEGQRVDLSPQKRP